MREIIFRGKRKGIGVWMFGNLIHQLDYYGTPCDRYFMTGKHDCVDYDIGEPIEVIPETVGQYTGLKDRNGKKIFEGDMLSFEMPDEMCANKNLKGIVYFSDGTFWVDCTEIENDDEALYMLGHVLLEDENTKIIGNIHDNKEVVK